MSVLVIDRARRSVRNGPVRLDAVRVVAVAVEPLPGSGNIRQRCTILAVGVELCTVGNDQPLGRAD